MKLTPSLLTAFLLVVCNLLPAQENESSLLSYSLSYIPPYLISYEGEFEFVPIFTNFEANIHYKPFNKISFTSGIGAFIVQETQPDYTSSSTESTRTNKVTFSMIRIPMQCNLHLVKSPVKSDSYLKAVYNNTVYIDKAIRYDNDEKIGTDHTVGYYPSIGVGIGGVFLKHKPVGILLEGTVEKYLRFGDYKNSTWYYLKVGIII